MRHASRARALAALLLFTPAASAAAPPADSTRVPWGGLAAAGLVAGAGLLVHPRKQEVPREGLDPADIALRVDRRSVRGWDTGTTDRGNLVMTAAVAYPVATTALLAGSVPRAGAGFLTQVEASLLTAGVTALFKAAASRPRPYTYVHLYEREDGGENWATSDSTFESFPSGHASLAWAATLSGATFLARTRPDLPAAVLAANGFVGGALSTATAVYRVEGGVHFPTDAVAGSLLGAGIGVTVPLLQTPDVPGSGRALRWTLAGVLAGSVAALLAAPPTSPF